MRIFEVRGAGQGEICGGAEMGSMVGLRIGTDGWKVAVLWLAAFRS